ncbi:unnamed protein product [Dibothriocephalus latus]|uniref:Uncharacterized protein n=1 Tax=Dibothriocephalus latus TaxID=60516 RepID=A0A3P7NTL5_DIBLA|nr:unnamed protein product [Dibothriocephalus latus]
MERNQKYEQNNSNEQIRKLRRIISELQNQLADTTRQLQGLQDNDHALSRELDNNDVQNLLHEAANALSIIPSRKPARRSRLLGAQETKPSPAIRNRSGKVSTKPKPTTEERTKKPVPVGRGSKKMTTPPAEVEKAERADDDDAGSERSQRTTEEGSNAEDTTRSPRVSAREASPRPVKNGDSKEKAEVVTAFVMAAMLTVCFKVCAVLKREILLMERQVAITDDITDSDTADIDDRSHKKPKASEKACKSPKLEDLQAELTLITERHENFKLESAISGTEDNNYDIIFPSEEDVCTSEDELSMKDAESGVLGDTQEDLSAFHLHNTIERKTVTFGKDSVHLSPHFELNKEDRLWEDLFGKDSAMNPSLAAVALQGYPTVSQALIFLPVDWLSHEVSTKIMKWVFFLKGL